MNGICHYLHISLTFNHTWIYKALYALISCDKPNARCFYSHLSNDDIVYWFFFFQCIWIHSETIPRTVKWARVDTKQTPVSLPVILSTHSEHTTLPFLQTIHRKIRTISPWPKHTLSSFSPLFCLFSNDSGLSPYSLVNNPMCVCLIQSDCVGVRDKDYLSH